MTHSNHGFTKESGSKPTATTNIDTQAFKLLLKGKLSDTVSFSAKYDAVKPGKSKEGLEYANVSWMAMPQLSLLAGKDRVNQGGWENKETSVYTLVNSPYVEYQNKATGMPFAKETSLFHLQFLGGDAATVTLQLVDDLVKSSATSRAQFNKANRQPATVLEYQGKFGMLSPLVQVGNYDLGHSRFYTLGVKAKTGDFRAILDYTMDNVKVDMTGSTKTAKITNLSLTGDYTIASRAKVQIKYADFNVDGPGTDVKGNNAYDATNSSWEANALADNGQVIMLALWGQAHGQTFQPYVAAIQRSGKFLKTAGGTESKSEMQLRLGVAGDF